MKPEHYYAIKKTGIMLRKNIRWYSLKDFWVILLKLQWILEVYGVIQYHLSDLLYLILIPEDQEPREYQSHVMIIFGILVSKD